MKRREIHEASYRNMLILHAALTSQCFPPSVYALTMTGFCNNAHCYSMGACLVAMLALSKTTKIETTITWT